MTTMNTRAKAEATTRRAGGAAAAGDPRICFDRVVPFVSSPSRAIADAVARQEVTRIASLAASATRGMAPLDADRVIGPMRAAIVNLKKWPNGQTLRCRFLMGSAAQRKKARAKAEMWEKYASINFKFVKSGDAEIRVAFMTGQGSWSAVGTDCLVERYFPRHEPTMNFGWLDESTPDDEWERVVVHEFGHALGLIHEHQNPNVTLKWNRAEVYRVFSGPPNFWSKAEIDHNILDRYAPAQVSATPFDDKSIMLYQFDARLFLDGRGTPTNTKLSDRDKAFIAQMYPK